MPTIPFELLTTPAVRLATSDCADNIQVDAVSPGAGLTARQAFDTGSYGKVPSAWCPAGSLQYTGYLEWTIAGTFTCGGAGTLQMQMDVDGTPTGTAPSWVTAAVDAAHFILIIRTAVSGDTTGATDFQVTDMRLTVIRDADNSSIIDSVARHCTSQVDSKVDHDIGWAIVTTANGSGVITNTTCIHVGQKSGT